MARWAVVNFADGKPGFFKKPGFWEPLVDPTVPPLPDRQRCFEQTHQIRLVGRLEQDGWQPVTLDEAVSRWLDRERSP